MAEQQADIETLKSTIAYQPTQTSDQSAYIEALQETVEQNPKPSTCKKKK